MNESVTTYINNASTVQKEIMEQIRDLIHGRIEDVVEAYKWNRPIFKTTKLIAYLQANKNHVSLGFYDDYKKLSDPDGLLEGTGKMMRHVKLRSLSDIDIALLSSWFDVLKK